MSEPQIGGHCDDGFLPVKDTFERNFDKGMELGASFALVHKGDIVVDLWGGSMSHDGSIPWRLDTMAPVLSCSKTLVSFCGLLLLDRGLIKLDEPVATYWPEFAAAGKDKITVRNVLSHTTGVPGWREEFTMQDLYDWDRVVAALATQELWWEPNGDSGYQIFAYGFLVGELVRRTTGQTLARFFRQEIAEKYDIDFHIGVRQEKLNGVSEIGFHAESHKEMMSHPIYDQLTQNISPTLYENFHDPVWLKAEIPGTNGVANARGMAKMGSILAMGGRVGAERVLSEEIARLPYQEQVYTMDRVFGEKLRFGIGFAISSEEFELMTPNSFHWGGYGGSSISVCPEAKASWAYVPNLFRGDILEDPRNAALTDAVQTCLKSL